MGQWEGVLYNSFDGVVLNPKRLPSSGGVNKSGLLRPAQLVMFLFVNSKFGFIVVVTNVGISVVWSWGGWFGLVPNGSLMGV